ARLARGASGRSRQARGANRALQGYGRGSRVALSAERQRRRRGGAGRIGIRRHGGGARRRSRRVRQYPRDRGRGRGRTFRPPAPGQAVAHEPQDLRLGGVQRRAGVAQRTSDDRDMNLTTDPTPSRPHAEEAAKPPSRSIGPPPSFETGAYAPSSG